MAARNIGPDTSHYRLLLFVIFALAMFIPGCGGGSPGPNINDGACPEGLTRYKGKCLTAMAIAYTDCTEDRGINTTTKVAGGVTGTLRIVTNASVNVASEWTRQEDRVVALQKIKDCLAIAKGSLPNDPEQRVVTRLIREYRPIRTLPPPTVPDVRPMTPDDAKLTLEILGFNVRRVEQPDDAIEEGKVIGTRPAAGATAKKGSTVELLISTSAVPGTVVPPVTGLQRDAAENELKKTGFTVQINGKVADKEPGTVLDQKPGAGVTADSGSTVTITIAVEPSPSPSPSQT